SYGTDRGRMWHGKDSDFIERDPRSQPGQTLHGACNGSTTPGERSARSQRGTTAAWKHHPRGLAYHSQRPAVTEATQKLARTLVCFVSWPGFVHCGARESQTGIFLASCLRLRPFRA